MGSTFYSKRYTARTDRGRKKRPKTFKTEEQAKKFAQEQGLKEYKIEMLKEKKYRVRA